MQEKAQIAWDPVYVDRVVPWQTRALVLFLFILCILWLIRSVSLLRQFGFLWRSKPAQSPELKDEDSAADWLAATALGGKLSSQPLKREPSILDAPLAIDRARARFSNIYEITGARIAFLGKLSILTFLVVVIAFAWRTTNLLQDAAVQKYGIAVFSGGLADLFAQLTLGSVVTLFFYLTYWIFEGVLLRRKTKWDRYCARE